VLADPRRRNLALGALALLALIAGAFGVVLGSGQENESEPERQERRISFLAQIIPAAGDSSRPSAGLPRGVSAQLRRLPLERRVAQLFLFGFTGPELFRRLEPGGVVLTEAGARPRPGARERDRVPPLVMTIQEGGAFNSLSGVPPADAPADLPSVREAARQTLESARALRRLKLTGVLGPSLDVGLESGSALGARVFSDDPEEVGRYARASVRAYESARVFSAAKHFPGLGSADQSTQDGPAIVGLDIPELRERDLIPFRAAIDAGVPGIVLSTALYPFSDFTVPASLSSKVARDLLRDELGFEGVAITDDLSDPAVTALRPPSDAAVEAVRAGADMVFLSGPVSDQQAAYAAVLNAVRSGRIPPTRLDSAVGRILVAKRRYGISRPAAGG
jgi:beta-N-acetylhexosaminidase